MLYFFGSCLFLCVLFFFIFRLFQKQNGVEEQPMSESDNNTPQIKYDVFVSFRGQDIRHSFLSHLTEAFEMKKINAFVDDKLEKGDEIWPSLVEAIEGSSISLIIFSPDYASSRWCLKELVKIHECKEKYGRAVFPVFYYVEPTDVRHQMGVYKNAFAEHGRKHRRTEVQHWRHALNKSADLAGIESSKFQNDAAVVKQIVNLVLKRLARPLVISKGLVGIEEKITTLESWIRNESEDRCLIGIWGMGGIGKTTLVEEVFNKLHYEYEGCYFLANEREESKKDGIISLKEKLFSGLLGYDVKIYTTNSLPEDIVRRVGHMKVLIILDDVIDLDHLEKLLGTLDNFGSGSRVIITTRDEQVLKANKVGKIYHLTEFSSDIAKELFNLNAFNQSDHQKEYDELSQSMVNYANGIPLVVKVLARLLCGKDKEEWKSLLEKLKKMPPLEVYEVMKLSYDGLDRKEQQIFLDLGCFFLRLKNKVNMGQLKSLLKDNESDESVLYGLKRLRDKALITFSKDNFVSMHDSLQEMALEIVRHESRTPGSRSRLWDFDDIDEALKNGKGTKAIRSIQMDRQNIKKQNLSPHIFAKMSRLYFLEISGEYNNDLFDQLYILAEGLQFLATELRFLHWDDYPLKSLPENFSAEKLVILNLQGSKMEKLWDGVKNLVNLKQVDLTNSKKLKELPDLSKATNLEVLNLWGCSTLTSVHPSIFSLAKLERLILCHCPLTILASNFHLCSLSFLNLTCCLSLREFSVISENMEVLKLGFTKVKALPSLFELQSKLELLDLRGSEIERLPSSINNLTQLLHLDIRYCSKLRTIPELPMFLETLDADDCTSLTTLPELPQFLKTLYGSECISLRTVLFPSTAVEQLKENRTLVLFWNCLNLDEHSLVAIGLNAQINVMKFANQHLSTPNHHHVENYKDYDYGNNYLSYQALYVYPGSSVLEWLEYKTINEYIIIDLSSAPPSPLLSFIFCFVFDGHRRMYGRGQVNITINDGEGEGKSDSVRMYIACCPSEMKSDHVCVMYDQRCSDFLNSRANNQIRFKIQVTVWERMYDGSQHAVPQEVLKGFGVSPISSSAYNSFIQQMESDCAPYHPLYGISFL